jgi:tetratricopeptide (TPR) repeat protein
MKHQDLMMEPNKEAVEAELAEARMRMQRFPGTWAWLAQVGRCLRWLGDPQAEAYFRKAGANFKMREQIPGDHVCVGNLYRLVGDEEAAQRHFEKARTLYAERVDWEHPGSLDVMHMIPASFLAGWDDEVAELIALLKGIEPDRDLIAYPIAKLAEAQRTLDADLAAEAVTEVARMVRRSRSEVWNIGAVTLWDWYETATRTWQAIDGEASGRRAFVPGPASPGERWQQRPRRLPCPISGGSPSSTPPN